MEDSIGTPPALSQGDASLDGQAPSGEIAVGRVEARLKELGLTPAQASLSARLGRDYVRDIMRGKIKRPGRSQISSLARALGVSVEYLLRESDDPGGDSMHQHVSAAEVRLRDGVSRDDRTSEMGIKYLLRDGYLPSHEIGTPISTLVVLDSPSDTEIEEWLELVVDYQGAVAGPGTLLHVIWPSARLRNGSIVITETLTNDPRLSARRATSMQIKLDGISLIGGARARTIGEPRPSGLTLDALLSGENEFRTRIVGHVVRGYTYYEPDAVIYRVTGGADPAFIRDD